MEVTATCLWPRRIFKLEDIACGLTWRGFRLCQVYLAQDSLHIDEYLSGFQSSYLAKTGQVLTCTTALRSHQLLGLMLKMVIMYVRKHLNGEICGCTQTSHTHTHMQKISELICRKKQYIESNQNIFETRQLFS